MFLDFYIGKIQNCHQKRKVVIEMKIIYRDFVRRPPPTSTHKAKSQARSAFKDEKQSDAKENEHDFLQLDHQEL